MQQSQMRAPESPPETELLDIAKFRATPLMREPYDYIIVPGFLKADAFQKIVQDYPDIKARGSFALSTLTWGPVFAQLLGELKSESFRDAVGEKFALDLSSTPTMITVRGMCGEKDGKIHTDTESKILSLLLYMNPGWEKDGGRLRLLKSRNIDDVAAEVPPEAGTLLIFRRCDHSFHGHKPFAGPRKVVQLNPLTPVFEQAQKWIIEPDAPGALGATSGSEYLLVASFAVFIGVIWFAVHPGNRQRFDEAARLPLEDDAAG